MANFVSACTFSFFPFFCMHMWLNTMKIQKNASHQRDEPNVNGLLEVTHQRRCREWEQLPPKRVRKSGRRGCDQRLSRKELDPS